MSTLSIAITSKNGKIIIARQFQRMTRLELEEHVVHFTRNIEQCKESTHIETDKARYVFLPLENLFIVLISNKSSNIIEDMEVLKLVYRLLQDLCQGGISDTSIVQNSIDIVLGIDDIVSLGYRESISLNQIQQCLKMDSQEEKAFMQLQRQRENEAKENFKKKMKEYEKSVKDKSYVATGISSSAFEKSFSPEIKMKELIIEEEEKPKNILNSKKAPSKGLKLGAKKQEIVELGTSLQETKEEQKEEFVNPLEEPIRIEIEEKIKCEITKDGELKKFDIKGEAFMTVTNSQKKKCAVQLKMDSKQKLVGLVIHPSILNKKAWNESKILLPENIEEGFPVKTKFNVIKYNIKLKDADLPFNFTCFNSKQGNVNLITFSVDYNFQETFKKLDRITIHIRLHDKFNVKATSCEVNSSDGEIEWIITNLHDNNTQSIEIKTTEASENLFPMNVNFALDYSQIALAVESAVQLDNNEILMCAFKRTCSAEGSDFKIINE